ncbi:acyl-CoA thioesterase [Haloferax mediterranei ATCC 33500]|uniref:Acyl-CoA thioester hydrolase n=1 Tax=Haloferax mediterranei (strain ATCC 33500 / DSM 1411 / JCM 8866 / NBRC 14739 / NCIMB 2177 / R-4) TaxID=523841 RepID=I3R0L6_HALMT|nr:acyl-CoA thioesterase [Haloferax mediterranei]AFK17776.1 acyl-CoA thioester hydrolase [Haloferax mediterranei ATCC 33500]AHZ22793.1 acyl-CoA thioester hydrolase [Haloferax mediterranei ATCC 33500]EMA02952.1 acyl-CoA thioester hydrolase [Haloferax mediterranei ATCC 33500]MDX5987866.1 acyl-CoA thioesterase [Haloferax mediterranei ATCC 33500]QCQ74342.1 acyl-CoA thioesterase [Haloferax mediterranei ATCC 33500]
MQQQSTVGTRSLSASRAEMSEILMPNDTNNLGRALGGRILEWMDICGAIAGRRYAEGQVVTASMDHVDFLAPIDVGDVVTVEAYVFDTGRTSMDIKVDVTAERPSEGKKRATITSFFTFVALDEGETPVPVPKLVCESDKERELRDSALRKREEHRAALAESDS